MTNIKSSSSVLKLKNFYFSNIKFDRVSEIKDLNYSDKELEIGFRKEHDFTDSKLTLKIFLKVVLPDRFELELTSIGEFECEGGSNDTTLLFLKNATAIMFPYIRSEITLLTSQPNLKPIIIPPININALFKKLEEQEQE